MLCLSRNVNEKIRIGSDVLITVVHISGGRVRIGVEAPKHVPVHREEVYRAIQREEPEK